MRAVASIAEEDAIAALLQDWVFGALVFRKLDLVIQLLTIAHCGLCWPDVEVTIRQEGVQ